MLLSFLLLSWSTRELLKEESTHVGSCFHRGFASASVIIRHGKNMGQQPVHVMLARCKDKSHDLQILFKDMPLPTKLLPIRLCLLNVPPAGDQDTYGPLGNSRSSHSWLYLVDGMVTQGCKWSPRLGMAALRCFSSSTSPSFPAATQTHCTCVVLCALQMRARSKQDLGSVYLWLLLEFSFLWYQVSSSGHGPSTCSQFAGCKPFWSYFGWMLAWHYLDFLNVSVDPDL